MSSITSVSNGNGLLALVGDLKSSEAKELQDKILKMKILLAMIFILNQLPHGKGSKGSIQALLDSLFQKS